jgi:hypothetical protein
MRMSKHRASVKRKNTRALFRVFPFLFFLFLAYFCVLFAHNEVLHTVEDTKAIEPREVSTGGIEADDETLKQSGIGLGEIGNLGLSGAVFPETKHGRGTQSAIVPSTLQEVPISENHIPVFITSVLWEVGLLSSCIYSLDVPVRKIVIILNSLELPVSMMTEQVKDRLQKVRAEVEAVKARITPKHLVVVSVSQNLGYGRSMNVGMKMFPEAEWYLLSNPDILYHSGTMASVLPFIWNDYTNGTLLYMLHHFASIVFTQALIRKVGYYDDHLWPAYVEDCDMMLRVRMITGDLNIDKDSGGVTGAYYVLNHRVSLTHVGGQGSPNLGKYNFGAIVQEAHANNLQYHLTKWGISKEHWQRGNPIGGCGVPMYGQHETPFNTSGAAWESLSVVTEHDKKQGTLFGFSANLSSHIVQVARADERG